jgi:UDP-glucose 4-epimerase
MSTIVIFGGAGFIGSALSHLLAKTNTFDRIFAIGRSCTPKYPLHKAIKYIQGNAADAAFVVHILKRANAVVDLSYSTVPKTSFENPLLEATLNLPACINIMQQCVKSSITRYLLVSSGGTIYGNTSEPQITERHNTQPISPYGIAKLMMEKYAFFHHQNFGLPAVIARPSNPFGLNQVGERPQGFLGNAISCLISGRPVTVFGEYGTVRDYIYIEDVARGLRDCLLHGRPGQAYNIGSGLGLNNVQALALLEDVFACQFSAIERQPLRPFDVDSNVLDYSKLRLLSGWQPFYSVSAGLNHLKMQLA